MREPRAPQWREPPKRTGPIEDPPLLELVERNSCAVVTAIAAVVLVLVAYAFAADLVAGHG
jgi:hypothetical protein